MKILFNTVDLLKGGGVSSYSSSLRACLGSNVEFFTVGSRSKSDGIAQRFYRIFNDYIKFNKKIINDKYSLVQINTSLKIYSIIRDTIFLFLAKNRKIKVLIFFHGWNNSFNYQITKYFSSIFAKIFNRADAFIVLSEEFRQNLIKMGIEKQIYIETTIVDDNIFDNFIPKRPTDRFNILYLSRVEKEKGIYETLDAYRLLKDKFPEAMLTVAGDGTELTAAKKYARSKNMDGINFAGFIRNKDKHRAFCNADVYLFPTYYGEGMPTTVLEAMAYGLPVITRSVGGLKDFFEHGKMGFITESMKCKDFVNFLEHLACSPEDRNNIGRYNRSYANQHFRATLVAQRIELIYRKIVSGQ